MTPAPAPASKLLTAFIKDKLGPVLLDAGFKATGRVYRRAAGDALHVVDVQNWKFNDSRRARFTIELGVCFPALLAAVAALDAYAFYRDNLGKPGVTECIVRRRIGELMEPAQDAWWTVSATTGHVPAVEEVTGPLLGVGLPWLETMSSLSAVTSASGLNHALSNKVMAIAALFAQGEPEAAGEAAAALAKVRHPEQLEQREALLRQLLSLRG